MNFETEITGSDGNDYHLDIQTFYNDPDIEEPKEIYLTIAVRKIVGEEKYLADNLELNYTVNTRAYAPFKELEGISKMLYDEIIEKLDNAYGNAWGYSAN